MLLTPTITSSLILVHALGRSVLNSDNASWDDKYKVISTHVLHPANQHLVVPEIAPSGDPEEDIKLMFASFSNEFEKHMRLAADVDPEIRALLFDWEADQHA